MPRMLNVAKVVAFNIKSRSRGVEMFIRCCFFRFEIENPRINPGINLRINPRINYFDMYVYIYPPFRVLSRMAIEG